VNFSDPDGVACGVGTELAQLSYIQPHRPMNTSNNRHESVTEECQFVAMAGESIFKEHRELCRTSDGVTGKQVDDGLHDPHRRLTVVWHAVSMSLVAT
jgi:hypothetical protein